MPNELLTTKEISAHFLKTYQEATDGLTDIQKQEVINALAGWMMGSPGPVSQKTSV